MNQTADIIPIKRMHRFIDLNTIRTINHLIQNTITVIAFSLKNQTLMLPSDHTNRTTLGILQKVLKLPTIHAIIQIGREHTLLQQQRNDHFDVNHLLINLKHVIPAMML